MTKVSQQAFSEVYEILSYLSEDNYNKIPTEILDAIEENRDLNYEFFVDTAIPFEKQDILEETKAILFNLYKDYLANDNIKNKILEYQREEQIALERFKYSNVTLNELFSTEQTTKIAAETKELQMPLIPINDNKNILNKQLVSNHCIQFSIALILGTIHALV